LIDKFLLVDLDACVRCYSCEIACKQEHQLVSESKSRWCRVFTIGPRKVNGGLHLDFVPVLCLQCENPPCAYFCPVNAISKREDGIVVVNEEICTGCRQCQYGCPYGVMQFNEITQKAGKCNLCLPRAEDGIEPSCVQHCTGGALRFVSSRELEEIADGKHLASIGRTYYLSSKWKLNPLKC
jgi:Fe-S-cluster-containing dehydrogenase component